MPYNPRVKELLEYLARGLVEHPDAVQVSEVHEDDGSTVLELSVDEDDYGSVIGRGGRTASALRTVIKAAAVSDYRPKTQAVQKIKRREAIQLDLEPTADILAEVAGTRQPGTLVVGFAAETEDHLQHGRDKLLRKGADALVLNDVGRPGIGFDSDRNAFASR